MRRHFIKGAALDAGELRAGLSPKGHMIFARSGSCGGTGTIALRLGQ